MIHDITVRVRVDETLAQGDELELVMDDLTEIARRYNAMPRDGIHLEVYT